MDAAASGKYRGGPAASRREEAGKTQPKTERKRDMICDKKNLAAGIQEMRSVAARLLMWAEDLEKCGAHGETARVQDYGLR